MAENPKNQMKSDPTDSMTETDMLELTIPHLVKPEDLNRMLENRFSVVLTDDYAPVDNLLAPIFEERFGKKQKKS